MVKIENFFAWIQTASLFLQNRDMYKDIAEDVETRFETTNFEIDRLLPKGKNKKIIGLLKDELGGKIIKEFVGLKAKTYSYLKENIDEDKKAKGRKNLQS